MDRRIDNCVNEFADPCIVLVHDTLASPLKNQIVTFEDVMKRYKNICKKKRV